MSDLNEQQYRSEFCGADGKLQWRIYDAAGNAFCYAATEAQARSVLDVLNRRAPAASPAPVAAIKTWQERLEAAGDWPVSSSWVRAAHMEAEIADLRAARAPLVASDGHDPLSDFKEGQWWVQELDQMAQHENTTPDQKRAVAVVHNMLRAALSSAPMAQAEPRPTDDELWDQTLRERDTYHEWADKLADAIATYFAVDIGEHSNQNCPWAEAFEAIEAATPAVPAAPSERDAELDQRAIGRGEALAILMGLNAEDGIDEYIGSHPVGCDGEWDAHWKEASLRDLFRVDDRNWSFVQDAEDRLNAVLWDQAAKDMDAEFFAAPAAPIEREG